MKRFLKYIGYVLCSVMLIFLSINFAKCLLFKDNYIFNYKTALILSGSMEPTLSVDDLVIVKRPDNIKVGDIISFYDENNDKIMHRIINIDGNIVTTQGDANNILDKSITKDKVLGIYVGKIKYVGKVIKVIKSPLGVTIVFLLLAILLLIPTKDDDDKNIKNETINNTKNSKKRIIKIVILVVLYLILLVICIMAGYYSKYSSELNGSSGTTVARFFVNTSSDNDNNLILTKNNNSASYTFEVSNKKLNIVNEVSTTYDVIVTFPSELKNVTLSLKNDGVTSNNPISIDEKTFIFKNVGTFKAGLGQSDNLTFTFNLDNSNVSSNVWKNIQISINATQID